MEENVTKSETYIVNQAADNLLSCLSPLISVAASHFPWICDVIRAVRPMTVYLLCIVAVNNAVQVSSLIAI